MTTKTLTRTELVRQIHERAELAQPDAVHFVESILETMREALACGESVKIARFGTFSLREKSSRVGRNPKTGEEAEIVARRVVTFKGSPQLKSIIEG